MKSYQNIKITKLENSEISIEGEIIAEKMETCRKKALEKLSKEIEIPGFRKGKAPENVVIEKIGEMPVLEEAAQLAIGEEYPEIIKEYELKVIGRPEVSITKIAAGNNLGFKLKTAVMPEIKIPSYKEIAKKEMKKDAPKAEVSEKEASDVLYHLQEQRKKEGAEAELNDEFARSLGDFKDLKDLRDKIKDNLKAEKINKEKSRRRMAIMEEILKASEISLPPVIVESELDKMISQFKEEVVVAGMEFKDYLSKIKKTENQIRDEWKPQAEKKAKVQIILNKIAAEEDIKPNETKVLEEVEKVLKEYPGADRDRARIFVETILTNEAVFEFLENTEEI